MNKQLDEIRQRHEKATTRYLTVAETRAIYLEWERDIEFLLAHIEALTKALRDVSKEHIVEDADPNWWCKLCGTVLSEDKRGHAPDCPFKILEDK